jgi:tyrosine-protein kinase Etk/Wzc
MSKMHDNEMTLKELLALLLAWWWVVAAFTLAGGFAAALYALSERPVYKVDALLQIETKDGKTGGSPMGALADMFQVNNPAETEIEVIKSRLVLGRVIEARKLHMQVEPLKWGRLARLRRAPMPRLELERLEVPPDWRGVAMELEVLEGNQYVLRQEDSGMTLQGRFGVGIDSSANPYRMGVFVRSTTGAVGQKFKVVRQQPLDVVAGLRQQLSVSEVGKKTGIVKMTLEGYDPDESANTLNEIANSYVRQNVERKSAEAEKTLDFLQEQLPEIKKNLELAEQRLNHYRSTMGSVDLTEEAKVALEQQVEVQQSLFQAQQKRMERMQLFKADHPNVLTLDSTIAKLSAKLAQQETQVKSLPMQQQEVVRLMRDVQVNTELYTGLLNSSQQLKVVKAGEIGNVRVIDFALPVLKPIKPKKPTVVALGLVLGFMMGAGSVLLMRLLRSGVEDPTDIERELGLSVYANIPHSEEQSKLHNKVRRRELGVHLLAAAKPDDLSVEAFRSLRTTLHFSMIDASNKILLLVGPSPKIGKSFLSANFAATLAMAGHRVLLMDADLRRGHIHQYLGRERGSGISDILAGKVLVGPCLVQTEVPGLQFLSTGTIPPNPSELLMHPHFEALLKELAERFDYIVVDSAPVLAVTDAVILGKLAGTTLMVLKHGQHPMAEIAACHKRLTQANVVVKGVVFNDVRRQNVGYSSYRYGAAAYQYKYTKSKKG